MAAVVHHGGAGTTAIGVALGKPTVVVPFSGDQPFWGQMIARAGAGPDPVPFKKMTDDTSAHSIKAALSPEVQAAAKKMGEQVHDEADGASAAAQNFQSTVGVESLRCHICRDRVAVWRLHKTNLRLSTLAASTLLNENVIKLHQLKL